MATQKATRRIKEIFPDEVSLVDSPAINEPFLVVKSASELGGLSLAEYMQKREESINYFTLSKGGTQIDVDEDIEKAFPGINKSIGSVWEKMIKAHASTVLELELLKRHKD